jgi:hypothetical protein
MGKNDLFCNIDETEHLAADDILDHPKKCLLSLHGDLRMIDVSPKCMYNSKFHFDLALDSNVGSSEKWNNNANCHYHNLDVEQIVSFA